MNELQIEHFLFLSATLFIIGMMGVLIRRNVLVIFMCVELMVNAVNIALVAFGWETNTLHGQGFVVFMGTAFLLINLIVDIGYGVIDPRVRIAK